MVSFTVILRPFQSPVALAVITELFWRQAQGADRGGQGRSGTDFPTGAPQVHDFDLVGVELMRHGGGGWCRMNPDSGRPKKVAPSPPPSRKLKAVSNIFATPWTVALQAPLSTGFPKQEYWSGLPFPTPGDLPRAGSEPTSPALQVDSLPLSHQGGYSTMEQNSNPRPPMPCFTHSITASHLCDSCRMAPT